MPSSVHPPHDAQKPRIWFRVSGGDNAEAGSFTSFVAERCMTVGALYQTSTSRYHKVCQANRGPRRASLRRLKRLISIPAATDYGRLRRQSRATLPHRDL